MTTLFQEPGGVSAYKHRPVALVQQVLLLGFLGRGQALTLPLEVEGVEARSSFVGKTSPCSVPQLLVVQNLQVSDRLGEIFRQRLVVPQAGLHDGQELGFQASLRTLGPLFQLHV